MSRFDRKTNRGNWSTQDMLKAIEKVMGGMPIWEAVERFSVSRSTLHERSKAIREGKEINAVPKLGRFTTIFPKEYEIQLLNYAIELDDLCMPLTKDEFKQLSYNLAVELKIPHTFDEERKTAGNSFFYGFLKCYPELILQLAQSTTFDHCTAFNKEAVEKFYHNLSLLYEEYQFAKECIYNANETGISQSHKNQKVLTLRKKKKYAKSLAKRLRILLLCFVAVQPVKFCLHSS